MPVTCSDGYYEGELTGTRFCVAPPGHKAREYAPWIIVMMQLTSHD